ncbi:integral membrane protein S linking to the trans Golgi network-domain-containing protein [Dactylonectria estremocensis]|uniref:Integral membrane protein S linking to the trans Golgi network-domain-containing protein n=1 Tax=Dactylonectria estremocensis TaxID=1079267 RepID=A0A9P9IV44_9HYPO|nr:integral membrane protein S linking to the trans Golgi network-domain-containing protein [Dactylonectria estremocensis]
MARRRRPPRAGALTELPPLKIASQIVALQALYYAAALVLFLFTALVAGSGFSFGLVFGWEAVRGDTTAGWMAAFVWMLDGGLCMAVALVVLIARSKLVPDFAITIHFLHLVVVSLYNGRIPRNSMWWATMLASSALSAGLGIWGCQYRELQPVFFGGRRILGNAPPAATGNQASEGAGDDDPGDGDEEMGFSRGRGRGRGRDGAGEYEMAQMEPAR